MNDRQKRILGRISSGGKASVNELADLLEVSPATIRQDLSFLEDRGMLRRYHGGAVLDETDDISHRMGINYDAKQRIARRAAEFVQDGETVFVESGSINALLVKELSCKNKITIITSNAFIAQQVDLDSTCKVVLLGGIYQHESKSMVGNLAKVCLETINYSKAFIGVDGYTDETGFTGRDMMRAEINVDVIKKSPSTYILTDSTKFGHIALSRYCGPEDVDVLITDTELEAAFHRSIEEKGVRVILV
jgi:DeoR/GlpR family transcriptional regulator of sugar metabolism